MNHSWDSREEVEAHYPPDKHDYIPVRNEDEGQQVLCNRCVESNGFVMAQARWFGPGDGVMIFAKESVEPVRGPEVVDSDPPPPGLIALGVFTMTLIFALGFIVFFLLRSK